MVGEGKVNIQETLNCSYSTLSASSIPSGCSVISVLSPLFFNKQTVPQEFEGPSVPGSTSLAEHPAAVSTQRLRTDRALSWCISGENMQGTDLPC